MSILWQYDHFKKKEKALCELIILNPTFQAGFLFFICCIHTLIASGKKEVISQ